MRSLALALALISAPAAAAPPKLTLEQVIEKAVSGPRVRMASADTAAASARLAEANAARLPRIRGTVYGTISPDIDCLDPDCTRTSPEEFAIRFDGLLGGTQLDVTQPLYTFGKIAHARSAARAGIAAQRALENEAAGDVAVDAARAYWGVKIAREMLFMLDDGIDEIKKSLARMDERMNTKDAPSIPDRQRIAVVLAEATVQRADARAGEQQALAGLRALTGIRDADVDESELLAVKRELPAAVPVESRPQVIAAGHGVRAYEELAEMAASYYWPDLALVGSARFSRAQGVDDPPSAFANDPYNNSAAGLVLALQWNIEPWTVKSRVSRARAEADKARAQRDLAAIGARYDSETVLAEAIAARDKLSVAEEGVKASRTWLAAVLQADAIGTADAKDLADAYLAWFQMRARWAQAVFQWNVAVVRLGRAGGEFRAGTPRP